MLSSTKTSRRSLLLGTTIFGDNNRNPKKLFILTLECNTHFNHKLEELELQLTLYDSNIFMQYDEQLAGIVQYVRRGDETELYGIVQYEACCRCCN